jgi:hypothetical protein
MKPDRPMGGAAVAALTGLVTMLGLGAVSDLDA